MSVVVQHIHADLHPKYVVHTCIHAHIHAAIHVHTVPSMHRASCSRATQHSLHAHRLDLRWERLMANVDAFLAAGGNAEWDFIVFEHNEHQAVCFRSFGASPNFTWQNLTCSLIQFFWMP